MNTAERFFRRYIFSTIRIIVLFLAVNVLLASTFFFIAYLNGVADSNFPIEDFSSHVTALNGKLTADTQALEILHHANAWAMVLNGDGTLYGKMACRKNCHVNTPQQILQCLAAGIWTIIP